jgi:AcrR family transcriptional regulator
MSRKPPKHEPKKKPRQERSRTTVDYILAAAAQILDQDGSRRLSTNRIAQKAGVAVASLYQYFPNKEAVVNALFKKELSEELAEFTKRSAEVKDGSIKDVIRVGVKSTIEVHARKPKLVKSILEAIPLLGEAEALIGARQKVIELVCETMRARQGELRSPKNFEIKAFLVVHAIESIIHAAANERPEYLTDDAFAEELVALIDRFVLEA